MMSGFDLQSKRTCGGEPTGAPAPLDVLVIGAGFSGICAGIKLLESGKTNFRIFEKSPGIGGTWWENTYPGAACDVPSHFYCFSFHPNPNWSRVYSPQAEIKAYLEDCVQTFGLVPFIEHGATVVGLQLDCANGHWVVSCADGRQVRALHVINGSGTLHLPSMPDIKGRDSFAGVSMHTARWNHSIELAGKRVAVVGSAASAIQIVPEIAKRAEVVTVFQRTPNYVVPRNDRHYSSRERQRFARRPVFASIYRWMIMMRMEFVLFQIVKRDSWIGRWAAKRAIRHMRGSVRDRSMHDKLTPDYAIGCKRILVSDNFFDALNRDNVELLTDAIDAIEPAGIRTKDGRSHAADIIVYATGFDIDRHIRSIAVVGEDGLSLDGQWENGAEAYNGSCVAGFPNYYMVTGPNTGVGTTSVVHMIEQEVRYILKLIELAGSSRLLSVRLSAQRAYNAEIDAALKKTVWLSGCSSWYLDADGRLTTLYPGNGRAFERRLRHVRIADFDVRLRPEAGDSAQG